MPSFAYSRAATAHPPIPGNDRLASGPWDDVSLFAAPVLGIMCCEPVTRRAARSRPSTAMTGGGHGDACRTA